MVPHWARENERTGVFRGTRSPTRRLSEIVMQIVTGRQRWTSSENVADTDRTRSPTAIRAATNDATGIRSQRETQGRSEGRERAYNAIASYTKLGIVKSQRGGVKVMC